jgi:hypothetical protein
MTTPEPNIDYDTLLKKMKSLEERLEKLEKYEKRPIKKKNSKSSNYSNDETILYKEFNILKIESDHVIALFSNSDDEMTVTQKFDSDQWNKLVTQLKAKDINDTLKVFDYSSGPIAIKNNEVWEILKN